MKQLRIAIVGYGTAGQTAAVLLTRDGHDLSVFERVPTPGPVGAGFLLQPSGLQGLWRMGLLPAAPSVNRPYPWGALWCLLPVGGRPDDPTRRLSFFWSLRTDAFAEWEANDLAAWMDELQQLWPEARDVFANITDPAQLARARYRDTIMKRWHRGRVVLVGDCAHAMSPQLGQGVNMALLDAEALTAALRDTASMETALQAYQRERRAHVWIYQLWGRWLTPVFQSERDAVAKMRDLAFRPMGRVPAGRGQMLRALTGTQRGLVGRRGLEEEFIGALARAKPPRDNPRGARCRPLDGKSQVHPEPAFRANRR